MKRLFLSLGLLALAAIVLAPWAGWTTAAEQPVPAQQQLLPNPPNGVAPNLDAAKQNAVVRPPGVHLPDPVPFTSKDGKKKGWKVVIPGNRPLATPAIVDGKVFIGGGFGSHEFYALDARTGKKVWQYQTGDDGPTAAVIEDEYIAFNTESCELEILTLEGKPVWKKWLGDPLMSMPAIAKGKVYMAYPDSKGDHQYHLACFDVKTGKEQWKKPIAGEIITAPVLENEQVYLATLEGTLYCFKQKEGELVWKEKKNATSSPLVWKDQCYFSRREETTIAKGDKKVKQQTEQVATRGLKADEKVKDLPSTTRTADYLDYSKRAASPQEAANQSNDAGVGFGGGANASKGSFKTAPSQTNIAQSSVSGVWSYQGSRPFVYNSNLYNVQGDTLQCLDPKTEKVLWKKDIHAKKDKAKELLDSTATPPALVNDKIFLGTTSGDVVCLSAKSGEVLWTAAVGEPIVFQPAVAKGRVYVSTNTGGLYCIETGDDKDDGWLMWGGNAAHNGLHN